MDEGSGVPIVFDAGSHLTKAGYAGEDTPCVVMRTVVGRPRHASVMQSPGMPPVIVGDDYFTRTGLYSVKYPITYGNIDRFDDLLLVYGKAYELLGVAPEERGVMVCEPSFVPFSLREWQLQAFFEHFNVRSYYADSAAAMSLWSVGKKSGMAIEMGAGKTQICAVLHGHILTPGTMDYMVCGTSIDEYLERLLTIRKYQVLTKEREEVRRCKETFCNKLSPSSWDFHHLKSTGNSTEELATYRYGPEDDPTEWKLSTRERFAASEVLFNPSLMGFSSMDLTMSCYTARERLRTTTNPNLVVSQSNAGHNASLKTPFELPQETREAILEKKLHHLIANEWHLFGGGSMFEDLDQRLQRDLRALINTKEAESINVIAHPDRRYSAWQGASSVASDPSYSSLCITMDEYNEWGPSIIHRKSYGGLTSIQ